MLNQKTIDCIAQHMASFLNQACAGRYADFAEPCQLCQYAAECNFDWITIMDPVLSQSTVPIRMVIEISQKLYEQMSNSIRPRDPFGNRSDGQA